MLLKFKGGQSGSIHLDYFQRTLVRQCLFTGTAGSIVWDLANSAVTWNGTDKLWHRFDYADFVRNDRFVAIVQSFMRAFTASEWDERLTTLEQGLASLQLVLAAKQSSESQSFVVLEAR